MKSLKNVLSYSMFLALGACGAKSTDVYSPLAGSIHRTVWASATQEEKPKLDLLFVVDNSFSMEPHQQNLANNIEGFVKAFTTNVNIDYHVGVISAFDDLRFKSRTSNTDSNFVTEKKAFDDYMQSDEHMKAQSSPALSDLAKVYELDTRYVNFTNQDDTQPVLPAGTLRPIKRKIGAAPLTAEQFSSVCWEFRGIKAIGAFCKDAQAQSKVAATCQSKKTEKDWAGFCRATGMRPTYEVLKLGRNYLQNSDKDIASLLGGTLRLGALTREEGSPIIEGFFNAVKGSIEGNLKENSGFFRPDAHLAIVIITDAEDGSSEVNGDALAEMLLKVKGGKSSLFSVSAAISPANDKQCPKDDGTAPTKILKLVNDTGGSSFSLCSKNFGAELTKLGRSLVEKVNRQEVALPTLPAIETISVKYGSQTLAAKGYDDKGSWTYNPGSRSVVINNLDGLKQEEGARILIKYTDADLTKVNSGRVDVVGGK